jgi:hypothetical protein
MALSQGILLYRERRREGFDLGFLPYMERRKIMEHRTKREK